MSELRKLLAGCSTGLSNDEERETEICYKWVLDLGTDASTDNVN
jgi:hypothetical protein